MSAITAVLRQSVHLDIFKDIGKSAQDVKAWVANQNYLLNSYTDSANFELRVHNSHSLRIAYANDCNRMSVAAFESVIDIKQTQILKKSGAWGVIKAYYSAFFAAHSIMRMYGISCSQIEQEHANKINEILSLNNQNQRVDKGFYCISTDLNFTRVLFKKFKDSHADTWECFNVLLNTIKDSVHNATALAPEKLKAIALIDSIKDGVTNNGKISKGNWLSQVRNVVNYQHKYGVWFPYEKGVSADELIDRIAKEWRCAPDSLYQNKCSNELALFFKTVSLILSLCKDLLTLCVLTNEDKSPIFINGALHLLNQASVDFTEVLNGAT
ncbi:hypothetical protein [Serratia fonticola]|uniref:hypothetical protein n=1 Tax=Serratia fonticola TaxID=47917 RepID=UPI000BA220C4|nr:hypothetical protein [Serratia fonticola]PAA96996.1 hypothetical protein CJJ13_13415 [Serratia fonticola]